MEYLRNQISELLTQKNYRVSIYKAGTLRFHEGFRFEAHSHREYEINYVNSGYCVMELEGSLVYLKQGDCIIISPGICHEFVVDTRKVCSITQVEFCVVIPDAFGDTISFFKKGKPYYKIQDCPELRRIMESICRCHRNTSERELYREVMNFSFAQLYIICSFYEEYQNCESSDMKDKDEEVIRYIEENYTGKLDLELLAKQFGISSRYIRKQILKKRGMSCSSYITMLRIAKAKKMLCDRSYSVTEVALQAGFTSSQYFCRVFSHLTGKTPTQFRNLCEKGERGNE